MFVAVVSLLTHRAVWINPAEVVSLDDLIDATTRITLTDGRRIEVRMPAEQLALTLTNALAAPPARPEIRF